MKMLERNARTARGFTLVEVLVASALLSVCMAMAMAGFSRVINTTMASVKCAVMHQELRSSMSRMTRDVMEADTVYDYGSGSYLILKKPTATGEIYVFYLISNKKLYRFQSGMSGSQILGDNIESLGVVFFNLAGNPVAAVAEALLVNVKVGGKIDSRGKVYTDAVETRVRLRNKQV